MKLNIKKLKSFINVEDLPRFFERYELFVVVGGAVFVFLIAGFIFYNSAYKTISADIEGEVSIPKIETGLFEQVLEDLREKKQPFPDESIIDPFR